MTKITSITVRRLRTTGNFNNVAHEATAVVPDGADPEQVRNELDLQVQAWNDQKPIEALREQAEELRWEVQRLRWSKANIEAELESLKRQAQALRDTPLEKLITNKANDDEVPF